MLLSLLVLRLLWLAPPASPVKLDPTANLCTASFDYSSIEYPFGVINATRSMREGFGIQCDPKQGGVPTLPLKPIPLELVNISLDGYVRVKVRAIALWNCARNPGTLQLNKLSLAGTPYSFNDTANKLTVVGCDALVLLKGVDGTPNQNSGCASFCNDAGDVIEGLCSGVGCCQASIPRGLKSFNLAFLGIRNTSCYASEFLGIRNTSCYRDEYCVEANKQKNYDNNMTRAADNIGCSKAFILAQDQFRFSADKLGDPVDDHQVEVVLDWAIGTEKCDEAENTGSYACKDKNSECKNSLTGVGYRCHCKQGFAGNPYIVDGCKDVDECQNEDSNPCVSKCINYPGRVDCARCPFGTKGDGRKNGTGCKKVEPSEIALGVGMGFLIMVLSGGLWAYWILKKERVRKLKEKHFIQNGGIMLQQRISSRQVGARIFSLEELEKATEGFSESRVIGRGGYGTVYKGLLPDQSVIAIKKSKFVDEDQIEHFINEVVILSQTNHRNVVKLLGCCLESQVPMLVYEFVSNGTLFHHVHEKGPHSPLPWEDRLRIASETAAALAYLHSAASIPIIHRDVKCTNILLDDNLIAKVSDFGASRLVPYDQTHVTTLVQGTLGYLDPEYFHTNQLTEKSDVYSFGVVLAELLTRQKPVSLCRSEGERNLASYFIYLVNENHLLEVIDRQTINEASVRHLSVVAELAKRCLSLKGEERPTMKVVAVQLDALRRLADKHFVRPPPPPPEEEELPVSASSEACGGDRLKKCHPEAYLLS